MRRRRVLLKDIYGWLVSGRRGRPSSLHTMNMDFLLGKLTPSASEWVLINCFQKFKSLWGRRTSTGQSLRRREEERRKSGFSHPVTLITDANDCLLHLEPIKEMFSCSAARQSQSDDDSEPPKSRGRNWTWPQTQSFYSTSTKHSALSLLTYFNMVQQEDTSDVTTTTWS